MTAGNLFSAIFLTSCCHFNFLASLSVLRGYIPSSALNTVLLVVLEHHSIFLAAIICTVSNCFTNFAFPSHSSPAYSNFGTIAEAGGSPKPSDLKMEKKTAIQIVCLCASFAFWAVLRSIRLTWFFLQGFTHITKAVRRHQHSSVSLHAEYMRASEQIKPRLYR